MVPPATALMDIPAEHWAQSMSLPTCWGVGCGRGVRRRGDGGNGGEKAKYVERWIRRAEFGESCGFSGHHPVRWRCQRTEGSLSLCTSRRITSNISFTWLTHLVTSLFTLSISHPASLLLLPPHLIPPDHRWPLGKHFQHPGDFFLLTETINPHSGFNSSQLSESHLQKQVVFPLLMNDY